MNNSIISNRRTHPAFLSRAGFAGLARLALLLCGFCICLPACAQAAQTTGAANNILHPPTKGPTPTLLAPKEIDLSQQLDAQGAALTALKLESPDGCLRLEIDPGTKILTVGGKPATRLEIRQDYPGKLPVEAYGVSIGYAYRFGPEELAFSAPARIVFSCLKDYQKTLVTQASVGIQGDAGQWDQLSVQGDDKTIWTKLEKVQPGYRYLLVGPAPMGS